MSNTQKKNAREKLYKRSGGKCEYCGVAVGRRGTIDHWIPRALGGANAFENLRWACHACNKSKGCLHPHEWRPCKREAPMTTEQRRTLLLAGIAQKARASA